MRNSRYPYTCPCCGYTTPRKGNMKTHLFKSKKPCPKIVNDITLSDDIKEYVLINRIYHVPKPSRTINHTINNYNFIQNFVTNMDALAKLSKYVEYNKIELIDFEDKVEEQYFLTSKKLNEDGFRYGYELNTQNFMEIIDSISSMMDNKVDYFNVLYDGRLNKIKLFERGVWKTMLVEQGIRQILTITKSSYLDAYECFLMRKIKKLCNSCFDIQRSKELLEEYYKFISCFEIEPFCKDHDDEDVLNDAMHKDKYTYSDQFYPLYQKTLDNLCKSEMNKIKKDVYEIVKRNTIQNIDELNRRVMGIIQVDEEFLKSLTPSS